MWSPTHVQVTVQRARNLLIKGKNGTNNPFITIALGKEKYQTSLKDKQSTDTIVWQEECELAIPKVGNTACVILTALHRNNLGLDDFLGTASIPLSSFDVYERPKSKWYKLEGKPGKEKGKEKERGEIEVRVAFTVKAATGSLSDLSKKEKHKSSMGQISNVAHSVGGSLLSLGSIEKRQSLKKLAKNIGKKVSRKKRDDNGGDGQSEKGSQESINRSPYQVSKGNVDPGVISEDEDEFTLDNLSHKSSGSSLGVNNNPALENLAGGEFLRRSTKGPPLKPPRISAPTPPVVLDEWDQKLYSRSSTLERGETLKRSSFGSSVDSTKSDTPEIEQEPYVSPLTSVALKAKEAGEAEEKEKPEIKTPEVKKLSQSPIKTSPVPAIRTALTPSPKLTPSPRLTPVPTSDVKENKENTLTRKLKQYGRKITDSKEKKEEKVERFIVGQETTVANEEVLSRHPPDVIRKFEAKSRDDLIETILELQQNVDRQHKQRKDLEDYLDVLLLRVMETTPKILQNPFVSCKTEANKYK